MLSHARCTFEELETTFYKHYQKVQNDEQVYMVLCMIKQRTNKKMEMYYGWIFKLANCLQDKANESLFTTLIHVILVPYLQITIVRMKKNILFEHKEVTSTYEKSMDNAND
jgi:hypothetical protein